MANLSDESNAWRVPHRLVVVSDPQAHLIGVLLADDARRLDAGETPEQVWKDCEGCPGRWSTGSVAK
jgi:hypothetical protein